MSTTKKGKCGPRLQAETTKKNLSHEERMEALFEFTVTDLKSALRAAKIGIPKSKTDMVLRLASSSLKIQRTTRIAY